MRYGILALMLLMSACGPITPSIPKSQLCSVPSEYQSRYDSVIVGDTWNEVKSKMQDTAEEQGDTLTYTKCKKFVFTFSGNVLVSKAIK